MDANASHSIRDNVRDYAPTETILRGGHLRPSETHESGPRTVSGTSPLWRAALKRASQVAATEATTCDSNRSSLANAGLRGSDHGTCDIEEGADAYLSSMHIIGVPAGDGYVTPALATASIAHEVSQPLTSILTNARMCERMLAADPPNIDAAREAARRTLRDGTRASDVLARLRALFSKQELAWQSVDLNEATREVIAQSLVDLQRAGVVLQSDFADDLPRITGDLVQLQQVISNLLRNAADAMLGIDDRPRLLLIRTERHGRDLVGVTVRDAGIGIDRECIHKLFDAFYTTKSGGMGIGLAMSRSIVERHQGRLWAESNDGPGATFCFTIPCNPECNGDSYDSESHAHCLYC